MLYMCMTRNASAWVTFAKNKSTSVRQVCSGWFSLGWRSHFKECQPERAQDFHHQKGRMAPLLMGGMAPLDAVPCRYGLGYGKKPITGGAEGCGIRPKVADSEKKKPALRAGFVLNDPD